jgi:DMSO/TMAO reductase YedYZ molybdopterin-dependent catalytic subunit
MEISPPNANSIEAMPLLAPEDAMASQVDRSQQPTEDPMALLDPEKACRGAVEAGLVVRRAHPLNCETPIPELMDGRVTPRDRFYVRNHFHIPIIDPAAYRLTVGGHVERPYSLGLHDLRNLPSRTLVVTLECAGNGRTLFYPEVPGEKWQLGAVSTAEWTGVPLTELLERAGPRSGAREVLFRGADGGMVEGCAAPIRFERSLGLDDARGDVLLAYAMNGAPLPIEHGFPLRAVVPGWYAVASVKWLTEIKVLDRPFAGHYQTDRYWYEWERTGRVEREPVALQKVRALITEPASGAELPRGPVAIRGVAWSGAAAIARVEVWIDRVWRDARLIGVPKRGSWQGWELMARFDACGVASLRVRATDRAGQTQPDRAPWNRLGYGNNSIHEVTFQVV